MGRSGQRPGSKGWEEADLLGWLASTYRPALPGEGVGDDAALLRLSSTLVAVTTDAVVEGVHFRRDWLSWAEIGTRAAYACLSDLAAMCARPVALFLSLGLPRDVDNSDVHGLLAGAARAAERYGARLAGGDTVGAPTLFADLVAVGEVAGGPWLRSGGRAGDVLAVTGRLGGPAAAVALLEAGRTGECPVWPALRPRFAAPAPRIDEAMALASADLHAAIDLSDGLLLDASRLAAASGCRAMLEAATLPWSEGVAEAAALLGAEPLEWVAGGGEEYELLLALAPAEVAAAAGLLSRFGCPLTPVGRLEAGEGVALVDAAGAPVPVRATGYLHSARGG